MIKKCCSRCKLTSFSACREVWVCPYCSEDISDQPGYSINGDTIINMTGDGGDGDRKDTPEKLRLVSGSSRN
ncbi:MAG: hypothetical protein M1130_03135 [Actinobacteria bacterium]|nr:hypothetical protein [Actinomycetota bacterium]